MNIAVCDDMTEEREVISNALNFIFKERGEQLKLREYISGEELISDVENGSASYDLIFQDIYMKGLTGIETAQALRQLHCNSHIVFLTAAPDYAEESYDVEASGYLMKPLNVDKLKNLIDRILASVERKRIAFDFEGHYNYVFIYSIMWIESRDHKLEIHISDGQIPETYGKLSDVETEINDKDFLRCHQSYLVNMNYVDKLDSCFYMRNGEQIPIRVRTHKQIEEQYHQWFLNKI